LLPSSSQARTEGKEFDRGLEVERRDYVSISMLEPEREIHPERGVGLLSRTSWAGSLPTLRKMERPEANCSS